MRREMLEVRPEMLIDFQEYLEERENAPATICKYLRDIRTFFSYVGENVEIDKERLLKYKEWLMEHYAVSSVNSMLVALNQFLIFLGLGHMKLKRVRIQRQDFQTMGRELNKEEFALLVQTAKNQGKEQLAMILETIAATGIRVSELKFFRVETIRGGVIKVWNKGKHRLVILPKLLQKKLLLYIRKTGIRSGLIFCTRNGREKDRSNIWREMKRLARQAGISAEKVFPHNLRHLFARTFYKTTKNLINLADILGHSNLETTRIYTSEGIEEWKRNIEAVRILKK